MKYTLKEVCTMCHVSRRALQGYEQHNLVQCIEKNKYGHNLYGDKEVERISNIKHLQDFGFSLKEIEQLNELNIKNELIVKEKEMVKKLKSLQENIDLIHRWIDIM